MKNNSHSQIKKLFLIDCFGAIVSAFMLGVVLVHFESYFGIPKNTLYFLAALPILFALYDLFSYFRIKVNLGKYLTAIAILNLLYSVLSLGLAIFHRDLILPLGWVYIIGEILIVIGIALYELKVARLPN